MTSPTAVMFLGTVRPVARTPFARLDRAFGSAPAGRTRLTVRPATASVETGPPRSTSPTSISRGAWPSGLLIVTVAEPCRSGVRMNTGTSPSRTACGWIRWRAASAPPVATPRTIVTSRVTVTKPSSVKSAGHVPSGPMTDQAPSASVVVVSSSGVPAGHSAWTVTVTPGSGSSVWASVTVPPIDPNSSGIVTVRLMSMGICGLQRVVGDEDQLGRVRARLETGATERDVHDLLAPGSIWPAAGSGTIHGTSEKGWMVPWPSSGCPVHRGREVAEDHRGRDGAVIAADGLERDVEEDALPVEGHGDRGDELERLGVDDERDRIGVVDAEQVDQVLDPDVLGRLARGSVGRDAGGRVLVDVEEDVTGDLVDRGRGLKSRAIEARTEPSEPPRTVMTSMDPSNRRPGPR